MPPTTAGSPAQQHTIYSLTSCIDLCRGTLGEFARKSRFTLGLLQYCAKDRIDNDDAILPRGRVAGPETLKLRTPSSMTRQAWA